MRSVNDKKADRAIGPFHIVLAILTLALVTLVTVVIQEARVYYHTPVTQRYRSANHDEFKPGGRIGHLLGITGSAMLVSLLSYSMRKRVRFMRNRGKLSRWLQFHIFLGITGPVLITLHTAFKLRGIVAISYWCMVIVAVSGMVGRYLYAQIPHAISGQEMESRELSAEMDRTNEQLSLLLSSEHLQQVQALTDFRADPGTSALRAVPLMVLDDFRWFSRKRRLLKILESSPEVNLKDRSALVDLARQRQLQARRVAMLKATQTLFRHWHVMHLPLAQTMYFTMVIHIAVAIMTGYF